MSPGRDNDIVKFLKTSVSDYKKQCGADVHELKEIHYNHDDCLNKKFRKHLKRHKGGWYKTGSNLEGRKLTFK